MALQVSDIQIVVEGILAAMLAALMRHFKVNREKGEERDEVVSDAAKRTEDALKEYGSQLASLQKELWLNTAKTGIIEERMHSVVRELERAQNDKDSRR